MNLMQVDAELAKDLSGPYFLGSFSLVDIMYTPFLERMAASLPYFKVSTPPQIASLVVPACDHHVPAHQVCVIRDLNLDVINIQICFVGTKLWTLDQHIKESSQIT